MVFGMLGDKEEGLQLYTIPSFFWLLFWTPQQVLNLPESLPSLERKSEIM